MLDRRHLAGRRTQTVTRHHLLGTCVYSPANKQFLKFRTISIRIRDLRFVTTYLLAFCAFLSVSRAQVPVYEVTPVESSIKFGVESSVAIKGTFDKWDASMTFTSPDVRSGVLEIKIQADSVNTGSGLKNNKLKGKDFFDAK